MLNPKRFVLVLLILGVIGAWMCASAQPQFQPLLFYTFTPVVWDPIPVTFGGIPAEDDWLIMYVCAGDDGLIDDPVMFGPDIGMPTGDDFMADPVQNAIAIDSINGVEMWGGGIYAGTFMSEIAMNCLEIGTGVEPVINVGDYVYLRAYNNTSLTTSTYYADLDFCEEGDSPLQIQLWAAGNPYEVFGCTFTPDMLLPVELMSFTATPGNNMVTLEWVTASETENKCFHIYRDDEEIVEIGTKAEGGESSEPLTYTYIDRQVVNGVEYHYLLTAEDINGIEMDLQELDAIPAWDPNYVVTEYKLHQNYPNPFNPGTTIEYDVLESGKVYLTVYNIQGQEVAKLIDGVYKTGGVKHVHFWNAEGLSSGVYFYQVKVNDFQSTQKMVYIQ